MTQKPVRIKVRCETCRAPSNLSPEQYRTLLRDSQVELTCPHCARPFVYTPLGSRPPQHSPHPPREVEPSPEPARRDPPPERAAPPEFPPPPFRPLEVGPAAAPAVGPAPAFEPLDHRPVAPTPAPMSPAESEPSDRSEAKAVSLNDRWKRLPPWVQWLAVGLAIVLLAVVIFAVPTGGAGDSRAEPSKPAAEEHRP